MNVISVLINEALETSLTPIHHMWKQEKVGDNESGGGTSPEVDSLAWWQLLEL